jgi:hypothetical protein
MSLPCPSGASSSFGGGSHAKPPSSPIAVFILHDTPMQTNSCFGKYPCPLYVNFLGLKDIASAIHACSLDSNADPTTCVATLSWISRPGNWRDCAEEVVTSRFRRLVRVMYEINVRQNYLGAGGRFMQKPANLSSAQAHFRYRITQCSSTYGGLVPDTKPGYNSLLI